MLAPRRTNRYSWLFPRAKKNTNMDNEQATFWLSQFIGKNLRIHASDGRVFGGQMKCTDKVGYDACKRLYCVDVVQNRNIILALAHEYRAPSAETIRKAVEESGNPSASVAWNSRYVGLIVVPGQHITKIEFEETTFPGQRSTVTL
jgi:small nuclear ribonucleoprotein (snRNP)-like protein